MTNNEIKEFAAMAAAIFVSVADKKKLHKLLKKFYLQTNPYYKDDYEYYMPSVMDAKHTVHVNDDALGTRSFVVIPYDNFIEYYGTPQMYAINFSYGPDCAGGWCIRSHASIWKDESHVTLVSYRFADI